MKENTTTKETLLNALWRNRHWTTKILWVLGLSIVFASVVLVMLFPPGITAKGYTFVYGETIKQGVLFTTIYNSIDANITANSIDECPTSPDGSKGFGNGRCFISVPVNVTVPDSFSFRVYDSSSPGLIGRVIPVKGDLRVGEVARLALEKDQVKEKGGLYLWDTQRRVLGAFWLPGFVVWLNEETYKGCSDPGDCGWGLLFIILLWFFYLLGGFVFPRDRFLVRLLTCSFVGGVLVTTIFTMANIEKTFPDRYAIDDIPLLYRILWLFVWIPLGLLSPLLFGLIVSLPVVLSFFGFFQVFHSMLKKHLPTWKALVVSTITALVLTPIAFFALVLSAWLILVIISVFMK